MDSIFGTVFVGSIPLPFFGHVPPFFGLNRLYLA
jgi:hypothetical protein